MSQIIIGDETIFQLNRNVSNHNVIRYASHGDPPEDCLRQTLSWRKASCMDWVSEEQPHWVNQNGSIPRAHWFQDGAPGHRLNVVHDRLQTLFPKTVMGTLYLAF